MSSVFTAECKAGLNLSVFDAIEYWLAARSSQLLQIHWQQAVFHGCLSATLLVVAGYELSVMHGMEQ